MKIIYDAYKRMKDFKVDRTWVLLHSGVGRLGCMLFVGCRKLVHICGVSAPHRTLDL